MNPRVRCLWDLDVAGARETVGRHEYDGQPQDMSPVGVRGVLSRLGKGPSEPEAHDEAHLAAFEDRARAVYGRTEEHRRNPLAHIDNLDLSCYDRTYAPEAERLEARRRHLSAWPEAVDASVEALDRVPAAVARALLPAAEGLAHGLHEQQGAAAQAALVAHRRFVEHLRAACDSGPPELGLGAAGLSRLMGDGEMLSIDLGRLADTAEKEKLRLETILAEACQRLSPDQPVAEVVAGLGRDHPPAEQVNSAAKALIAEVTAFTGERALLPPLDGECRVGAAPESRRLAMAMMSWAAPYEADAPSWYYVTPPEPAWSPEQQEDWLAVFSRTSLPAITAHEVTPGHFAHGRMLRRVQGDVRRGLHSSAFIEGWAHYAEELMWEEGFRADDPRYAIGMCTEALIRATRLRVALGVHAGGMTMQEATRAFEQDAFLKGPAAQSEAWRATYDPTYGRYTWGKLEIKGLRDEAVAAWGRRYSHLRFHQALLAMGAPPLGLIGDILT
jgi:hypothetical protein